MPNVFYIFYLMASATRGPRTVQRYIAALQATGEWIEYDRTLKGWGLQKGVSILFGDHLDGEQ